MEREKRERFEREVLPCLDAAFNLARWLLKSEADAEDVVQDAMVRAFRFYDDFRGGPVRPWLLTIVRNSCYTWLQKHRVGDAALVVDAVADPREQTPEGLAMLADERALLARALETLSLRQREVLVLRELEGCSYKGIAGIAGMPIGTVMSTLARARLQLRDSMERLRRGEVRHAV
jgi:RNA polymerase sigma-70 factor (ECF subfamily)